MKKSAKLLFSVLLIAILAFSFSQAAFAASQDGLTVTINSDKAAYTSGETAKVTVTVENTNSFEIKDISVEHIVPEELKKIGLASYKETISLAANAKAELTAQTVNNSQNTSGTSSAPGTGGTPSTGDKSGFIFVILLAVGALSLLAVIKYRKNAVKLFSLLLCLTIAAALPIGIMAAESTTAKSFETVKALSVDGKSYNYKVVVSYPFSQSAPETESTLTIDLTKGKNSDCFAGLTSKTLQITVSSSQSGDRSYDFSGFYLSEVFAKLGINAVEKIEAVTSDMGAVDITALYNRDGDIFLAWGEGNPPKNETPIRVCPKNAQTANELYKNVERLIIN